MDKEINMNLVTKDDVLDNIVRKVGVTRKLAKEVFDSALDYISDAIVAEQKVSLFGFGVFKPTMSAARTGRNPKTGETIQIPDRYHVSFKSSKKLKDNMNAKAGK